MKSICSRLEGDGERTRLQHEREFLRLAERAALSELDLRAVVPGDAVRVAHEVDVRHRLDLPVEHDREVLRTVQHRLLVALTGTGERTALGLTPCDRVEDLLALA